MGGKTAVTGGTGFLGSHIVRQLVESGRDVVCLARPRSDRSLLADLEVEWREGDLRDRTSLDRFVSGCEDLFHCAADYRFWSADPAELYRSNVGGTRKLMAAARAGGVERVVYTSTVGVLGIPAEGGSGDEQTPVSLQDMVGHYKRSKFLAEEAADLAAKDGLHVVIVNPSTPVGPGDIKPTPTGKLIVDFLNGRMPAYVDTGLNVAPVSDVARGHLLALERGRCGRRYILGGRNMTLRSILDELALVSGFPSPWVKVPQPVAYAAALMSAAFASPLRRAPAIAPESVRLAHVHMFFDSSRAENELGYHAGPAREALVSAVVWYLQHGYVSPPDRASRAASHLAAFMASARVPPRNPGLPTVGME